MLNPLKKNQVPLAVDFSHSAVKILWADGTPTQPVVRRLVQTPLPPNAIDEAGRLVPGVVGPIIRETLRKNGIPARHVVTAVSAAGLITKTIRMPFLTEAEEEDQIQVEAPNHIPYPVNEVRLDFVPLPDDGKAPGTRPCLLAAARQEAVNEVVLALEAADLTVDMVGLQSQAVAEVARATHLAGRVVVVDLGATTTTLYLLEDGLVIQEKEQASGTRALIDDVRRAASLSSDAEALRALREHNLPEGFDRDVLDPFREATAQHVARLVQFVIEADARHESAARIILTGGGSLIQGMAAAVREHTGVPTEGWDPFQGWRVAEDGRSALKHQAADVDMAGLWVLAGLGLWAVGDRATSGQAVNFTDWRAVRRARRQKEFGFTAAASAAAGVLLVLMMVARVHDQTADQQSVNDYLGAQIKLADRHIKDVHDLHRERTDLLARKKIVESLQNERSQMVHVWTEMALARPTGVRLTTVKQVGQDLDISGVAKTQAAVSATLRNLEKSQWIGRPNLKVILAQGGPAPAAPAASPWVAAGFPYVFQIRVQLHNPNSTPKPASGEGA